jgi:3-methyladenine DNA glycosylase/8-oxoguanine DNA glycosylase
MLDKTPALIDGGPINEMARRMPGLRLGAPGTVFETLSRVIVEQRVTARDAKRSYRRLVLRYGEHAPGPLPLVLPPSPERLYELRYPCYHELGIERRRAETIRRAAYSAARLDETAAMSFEDARRRLRSIPGVGQWTTGYVLRSALGDPDAVILGDFHFPNMVAWALAGEARADDKRMLQLLRPYAGQRGRVMRLLEAAGIRAPKFGPRRRVLAIETF